ncbi:MAG TPA: chemoreceptor glutamine deamidase CheD [Rhabdaerophilum sp.]|nr:chemoreceptor glutamine deamidase CheD [Rhabdaerophilum sp.]
MALAADRGSGAGGRTGRIVRVLPGDFHVTDDPATTVVTVLGSCVAACIRNPYNGFGGLNHFMLPESESDEWNGVSAANRYGNFAMEALINAVLKSGCTRQDLEVKLFGGASMHNPVSNVGGKNAAFARHYLDVERIPLASSDLGGDYGRRIHYSPTTGKVQRLLLKDREDRQVITEEARYGSTLSKVQFDGDIDLFD